MRLQPLEARDPGEIDNAFAAMTAEQAGAVIVLKGAKPASSRRVAFPELVAMITAVLTLRAREDSSLAQRLPTYSG